MLNDIVKTPHMYLYKGLIWIFDSSMSEFNKKMKSIKSQNYDKSGEIDLEKSLKMINKFYLDELEEYCNRNRLNVIRELEIRKGELEQDMEYIVNIMICIFTGILSTGIINIYFFWSDILQKSLVSSIYKIILMMISIIGGACVALFFPVAKIIIKNFRNDKKAEIKLLEQYELRLINEILNNKIENMLK